MRTLVVYESMYGNTHAVAEHIAAPLRDSGAVLVVPVRDVTHALVDTVDLLVVGGPTHAHSLPSKQSRKGAKEAAAKPDSALELDPDATGPGLRDWFHELAAGRGKACAAFDTRFAGPPLLTGRASRGIARRLHHHGYVLVTDPESFLVDKSNQLLAGEAERAEQWGALIASTRSVAH